MKYTTKVNLSKKKGLPTKGGSAKTAKLSRLELASRAKSSSRGTSHEGLNSLADFDLKKWFKGKKLTKSTRKKIRNVALVTLGLFIITGLLGGLWFFSYLQRLNDELPSLSDPFREKELASVVYDRTGRVELARLIGDYARDPVNISDVPEHVKWSFLAAEDIDFYTHQGFDPAGILRCGIRFVTSGGGERCGGSTITQQVIKITVVGSEVLVERKLKEMLMAIKIEQAYTKDEILQLYLTVAPFGGNIYGITTAARFYFGKEVQDLTLAEGAILASIIQNPTFLSPTKGLPDPKTAQEAVKWRQENVVLTQLRRNINKINEQTRSNYNDPELDDVITDEMIDEAFAQELDYKPPVFSDLKAGHFVDYVRSQLTSRNYKFGEEPFTETELLTGGYEIYTTLDWDIQQVAQQAVADAVATSGAAYGASNAALVLTHPSTGHVIALVGSKNYYGQSEGCDANGRTCRFDPQVNIISSRQSPGSSTKPFGTYEAYRQGLMFTGSFLPDIPINAGGLANIKNWNAQFVGVTPKTFAGQMLADSRNLPAIITVEAIGIQRFLDLMTSFGYTTFGDSAQFGHSVILGGSDVIPMEHAQGYGVFANGGDYVRHEVITKIVDRNGVVVYEHTPKREKVADEKAVFMLNQSILNNHQFSWDNRNVSAKSGTSQDNMDTWMAVYSPDFVAVAWMGNNNNEKMSINAFGETMIQGWLKNFLRQVGDTEYFAPRSEFARPAGIRSGGGCSSSDPNQCIGSFQGIASGWMIDGVDYPADNVRTRIRVCKDQKDRLARPIDEFFDNAEDAVAITYSLPYTPQWQRFLDEYMASNAFGYEGIPNGGPKEFCTRDYSGQGVTGVWIGSSNLSNNQVVGYSLAINGTAFTVSPNATPTVVNVRFDSSNLADITVAANGSFTGTVNIPADYDAGTYRITLTARDSAGSTFVQTYDVILTSANNGNMQVSVTGAGASGSGSSYNVTVTPGGFAGTIQMNYASYTGAIPLSNVQACISTNGGSFNCSAMTAAGAVYSYSWNLAPETTGNSYVVYVRGNKGASGSLRSANVNIAAL